jgi:type II secretory pathway component PulF
LAKESQDLVNTMQTNRRIIRIPALLEMPRGNISCYPILLALALMIIISCFLKIIIPFVGLAKLKNRTLKILTQAQEIMKFLAKLLKDLKYIFIIIYFIVWIYKI